MDQRFDFEELEQSEELALASCGPAATPACGEAAEDVERWIFLRPRCGLANRLRSIVSGLLLARHTGFRLAVEWRPEADCNCPWRRLFGPLPGGAALLGPGLLQRVPALRAAFEVMDVLDACHRGESVEGREELLERWRAEGALRVVHHDLWREPDERWLALSGTPLHAASPELLLGRGWLGQRCLAFGTTAPFYPPHPSNIFVPNIKYEREHSELLQQLRPAEHIANHIQTPLEGAVALHVRRGDHDASREVSTLEAFLAAVEAELAGGRAHFFLATDCAETEERLVRRFGPERMRVYRKRSRSRARPEAIEDALVDLISLGLCSKILGSHRSSFTDLAALLHLIPKVIVKAPSKHDPWAAGPPDKCERNEEAMRSWRDR